MVKFQSVFISSLQHYPVRIKVDSQCISFWQYFDGYEYPAHVQSEGLSVAMNQPHC
jgi:hypothetical protein